MKSKMTQVGVAWKKTTQSDKTFLSIVITNPTGADIHLTLWPNSYKEKEGQPDYILYKSADERPDAKSQAKQASDFPEDGADASHNDDEVPF